MYPLVITSNKVKRFVPTFLKRATKEVLLNRTLRRAIRESGSLARGDAPNRQMLEQLQLGWANTSFAARTDYLEALAQLAVTPPGPVLECGTGLTTILLGLLAGRRGVQTWSLEHNAEWRDRVTRTIMRFEISNVEVCLAPLSNYDGFEWYRPQLSEIAPHFQLVICDGPP